MRRWQWHEMALFWWLVMMPVLILVKQGVYEVVELLSRPCVCSFGE